MKRQQLKKFAFLLLVFFLSSVVHINAQTQLYFGSDASSTPYTFSSGDIYMPGLDGTESGSFSTSGICGLATKREQTSAFILQLTSTSASAVSILGGSSGSARTLSTLEYADSPAGPWTAVTFTTDVSTITSSACGEIGISGFSIPSGKYVRFTLSGNVNLSEFDITGDNGPSITPTPNTISGLYYNIDAGPNPVGDQFSLDGLLLTDTEPVTVTAPSLFQVYNPFTSTWVSSFDIYPSGGSISQSVSVRIDPTDPANTSSTSPSGNVTFSQSEVGSIASVAVSGTVVDLAALDCPTTMTISNETFAGADFTWSNAPNNNGYLVNVYKAGVQVGATADLAQNTTSYTISGLDELTAYTARVTVKGNGTTTGNSFECATRAFTTSEAPANNKVICWTEDFEALSPSANTNGAVCPSVSGETTNEVRFNLDGTGGSPSGTARCDVSGVTYNLSLPSGLWTNCFALGATDAGHSGSSRALFLRNTYGTFTLPTLDNPRSVTFYVYAKGAVTNAARGISLVLDGTTLTSDIQVDDVLYTTADGLIRFASAGWHKVSVELTSNTQNSFTVNVSGDSSMDVWIDDFTVECSSMDLTAYPNVAGLNYVVDMGPSSVRTFTISGTDLPIESGNITLSNLGNFQLSLDNGATWSTGSSVNLPYTSSTFATSVMVRLKAGLGISDYTTSIAFSCPGYTKTLPTLTCAGKVTLLPQTLPCGEEVTLLSMKGTNEANILLDGITGTDWTAAVNTKNNHFLLKKSSSLISPTISLSEYDVKSVTFKFQPTSTTAMTMSLSCFGDNGSFTPVTFSASSTSPYSFTQDLSAAGFTDNFYLSFTDGSVCDIEMWDIVVKGVSKRQINLSEPTLSGFTSYSIDCPSEKQSFVILGTCLDDNSTIDLTSSLFEFSSDGITWETPDANDVTKLSYVGTFPIAGMKVYVRQKGTAGTVGFTATESVSISNAGAASNSILLTGTVSPPSQIQVPTAVAYSSVSGVPSIRSITIEGGLSCNPLVVTHNCSSLSLSDCEGGTYGSTATFGVGDSIRTLYLQYTPGANLNCTLTLTSGTFTQDIALTWNGVTAIASGVAVDKSNLTYEAATGYGIVNAWKAGGLDDATIVTITSTDFDVSMGNPDYGDFVALTSANLGNLKGSLFVRQKTAATSGTITLATAGGNTTTINVTVQ